MSRFGENCLNEIESAVIKSVPENTKKNKASIWSQFSEFCKSRNYELVETTTAEDLSKILLDWAYNMRKLNGENYKEGVIKTIWNVTAKTIQEMYYNKYNKVIDPFNDIIFKKARDARNAKRKELQADCSKRKLSSTALTDLEHKAIVNLWNEETPSGLQRKFYHIASVELAWRGGEAVNCILEYFKEEINNTGTKTGRIEYNSIFSKTAQGGSKRCAESKWLLQNLKNPDSCPVRLFHLLLSKRTTNVKTNRLFLNVNPDWERTGIWYKNSPMGRNQISSWTQDAAQKTGLDVKKLKITNHSNRSTAVSKLAKSGIHEQQLIKITGHSTANSIKPYLQLDPEHHEKIIQKMRNDTPATSHNTQVLREHEGRISSNSKNDSESTVSKTLSNAISNISSNTDAKNGNIFQNCTFIINCNNVDTNK